MKIIYPPKRITTNDDEFLDYDYGFKIFLAGTIDMGNSDDWQSKIIERLKHFPVTFFNPRRPDWDNSIEQSISEPRFVEQVTWELDMLSQSDLIVMYLAAGSKSPISLMELGIFVNKNIIVYCPKDFYRKGNVDIVCEYFQIDVVEDEERFFRIVEQKLKRILK